MIDMSKCIVVVIAPNGDSPPTEMTPQMMQALVKARESHIKYKSVVNTAVVQLLVAAFFLLVRGSNADTVCLGVLGGTLFSAAMAGLGAWAWKRRFSGMSSS